LSFLQAFFRGLRHTGDQSGLVGWLWLANLLIALPAGVLMVHTLDHAIGPSLVHENLRQGFDLDWYGEIEDSNGGLLETFRPSAVVATGPLLDNLEGWITGRLWTEYPALLGMISLFLLAWVLLQGGVLARLHDPLSPRGLRGLLEAGADLFFRLLRLAILSAPLYFLVYKLGRWLLGRIAEATREVTRETTVLLYALAALALVAFLLLLVRAVFDYARIAVVVENRHRALGAVLRGLGFVLSRPGKVFALVAVGGILALAAMGLYALLAPSVGTSTVAGLILGILIQQLYLMARIAVRVTILGSELELYKTHRVV
jgi:hypothetical protein